MERRKSNIRAFASPLKYIQGAGELGRIKQYTDFFGKKILFLIDAFLFEDFSEKFREIYKDGDHEITVFPKAGEITVASILEYKEKLQGKKPELVVSVGGGKTIDTGKVLAQELGLPMMVVPTVASTDAPTSALSVIYKENGEHSHEVFLKKNPDLVLVDSEIIAKAPARLLVSGMGDALATYFEAQANIASNYESVVSEEVGVGVGPALAAKAIARLCYEVLLEDGRKAREAAELGVVTEALENVIEANTLLSGIGFESNGTAAAHSINDGFTVIPEAAGYYHGERVAFGVLCELVLENADKKVMEEVYRFCISVGLPVTMEQIGVKNPTKEQLHAVAESAYHNVIHAEPMAVTVEGIISAILVADATGKKYLAGKY